MTKTIIFHLGGPKTGSTSVQHTLATQNWACPDKTLIYPTRSENHFHLAQSLLNPKSRQNVEKRYSRVARKIANSSADVAVISSEHFIQVKPAKMLQAIDQYFGEADLDIKLIAYARPHPQRILSACAQQIKTGKFRGSSLAEFVRNAIARNRFQYFATIRDWHDTFGDRFTFRIMNRSDLYMNCVVRDFLNFAFDGKPFQLLDDPIANESLSVEDLAILHEIHATIAPRQGAEQANTLGSYLARTLAAAPGGSGTRLELDRAPALQVQAAYAEDARLLDQAFMTGTPFADALEQAVLDATAEPQMIDIKDHLTQDECRMLTLWAGMTADLMAFQPEGWAAHFNRTRLPAAADDAS